MMPEIGAGLLGISLISSVLGVACLVPVGIGGRAGKAGFGKAGWLLVLLACLALLVAVALIVACFITGDTSIRYVSYYRSDSTGSLAWLYRLSGLWGGREGSLLFWALLMAALAAIIGFPTVRRREGSSSLRRVSAVATSVVLAVVVVFCAVLLFSPDNRLFEGLPERFVADDGLLQGEAALWGLSSLLEHWAMAVHPPLLFIGYAALLAPFSYAVGGLALGVDSRLWARRCRLWAIVGWLFLSAGMAVGALWAYTVLGWGGFWGWDAVENASLLPWLSALALMHSLRLSARSHIRGRTSAMLAAATAALVMFAAFLTRSGIIGSVHAFDGDATSRVMFAAFVVLPLAAGALLCLRGSERDCDQGDNGRPGGDAGGELLFTLNNTFLLGFAGVVCYMTMAPVLPPPLPFAGQTFSATSYQIVAAPLGILYLAMAAACNLFALYGGRSAGRRHLFVLASVALVLFGALVFYASLKLFPSYFAIMEGGGSAAEGLCDQGPWWYYNGLAVIGLLVASVLFCTSALGVAKQLRSGRGACAIGGFVTHAGMAIVLVGLIGSTMYATSATAYLPYDEEAGVAQGSVDVGSYHMEYRDSETVVEANRADLFNTVFFEVFAGDGRIGELAPAVQMIATTQQHQLHAAVLSMPLEDLFVVYRGVNSTEEGPALILDASIHPLIGCVWIGFVTLTIGGMLSALGCLRRSKGGRL